MRRHDFGAQGAGSPRATAVANSPEPFSDFAMDELARCKAIVDGRGLKVEE